MRRSKKSKSPLGLTSAFPRTIKVKDLKACFNGFVEIRSIDYMPLYYAGSFEDMPFIYLYSWVASLDITAHYDCVNDGTVFYLVIFLES